MTQPQQLHSETSANANEQSHHHRRLEEGGVMDMDDENGADTDPRRLTDNAENETGFFINEDDDDFLAVIAPESPSPNISDAGGSSSTVSGINSMGEQLSSNAHQRTFRIPSTQRPLDPMSEQPVPLIQHQTTVSERAIGSEPFPKHPVPQEQRLLLPTKGSDTLLEQPVRPDPLSEQLAAEQQRLPALVEEPRRLSEGPFPHDEADDEAETDFDGFSETDDHKLQLGSNTDEPGEECLELKFFELDPEDESDDENLDMGSDEICSSDGDDLPDLSGLFSKGSPEDDANKHDVDWSTLMILDKGIWACAACSKIFEYTETLSHHINGSHWSQGKVYPVGICSAGPWVVSTGMSDHICHVHCGVKRYERRVCGVKFPRQSSAQKHFTRLHKDRSQAQRAKEDFHVLLRAEARRLSKRISKKVSKKVSKMVSKKVSKMVSKKVSKMVSKVFPGDDLSTKSSFQELYNEAHTGDLFERMRVGHEPLFYMFNS